MQRSGRWVLLAILCGLYGAVGLRITSTPWVEDDMTHVGKEMYMYRPEAKTGETNIQTNLSDDQFNPATDHLLIYQYGKVASDSMMSAMRAAAGLKVDFGEKYLKPSVNLSSIADYPAGLKCHDPHLAEDFLSKLPVGARCWIITICRNHVSRDVSAMFEWDALKVTNGILTEADMLSTPMGEWHSRAKATLSQGSKFFQGFDSLTGANLLHTEFDHEKKHIFQKPGRHFNNNPLKVILLRFEDIPHWAGVLKQYFPDMPEEMPQANVGGDKFYAGLYENFKATFPITRTEWNNFMDNSDSMRFYSNEEIRDSMLEWHATDDSS